MWYSSLTLMSVGLGTSGRTTWTATPTTDARSHIHQHFLGAGANECLGQWNVTSDCTERYEGESEGTAGYPSRTKFYGQIGQLISASLSKYDRRMSCKCVMFARQ